MSTIELRQSVLNDIDLLQNDDQAMNDLYKYLQKLKSKVLHKQTKSIPCNYTTEEVKLRIAETYTDALVGKGICEKDAEHMIEEMA